jgi:DNA-binding LacI/PurR family transcriptional regulator
MATIADVARRVGVSTTTVSRVINNFSLVNAETRKRVLVAIEELHYSPSIIARGMRGQKTRSIGVVIPDFRSYWYSELLNYIEIEARNHDYLAIICSTEIDPARELEYLNDLLQRQVDGLILCWYRGSTEKYAFLRNIIKRVPLVVMDQPATGFNASSVYTDGYKGIKKITKGLIAQGHQSVAMIVADKRYSEIARRYHGYRDAMRESGRNVDRTLIVEQDIGFNAGYDGARTLFSSARPTAIVTADDLTAIGVLQYCHDNSISVPKDVSVTGFDNILISGFVTPRLTTISQPAEDLARSAVSQIMRKIGNKRARNQEIVFEPKIILRESTTLKSSDLEKEAG